MGSDEAEGLGVLGHFLKPSLFASQASATPKRRVQFSSHPSTTCSLPRVGARRLNDTALQPPSRSPTLSELFWSHKPRLLEAVSAQGGVYRMGGRLEG